MISATRCRHCSGFVSRDIQFNEKGNPFCIVINTNHAMTSAFRPTSKVHTEIIFNIKTL